MNVRLSGGNDPDHVNAVPFPIGVDDDEPDLTEIHTDRAPAFLPIHDSIGKGQGEGIIEYLLGGIESHSMLAAIRAILVDIPFEPNLTRSFHQRPWRL